MAPPIVDVHVHPVSRDLVRDARNLRVMEHEGASLAPSGAVERLLERMDAGGITWSCLMGPAHGDGIALTNEMVRDAVRAHPQKLVGFVGVDPLADGEGPRDVIVRAVQEWGFRGVGEFANVDLLDPRCDAVYRTCIELDVPLLVHVGIPLPSMLLKHGHPFALDEIALRYPELKLIAAHVGMPWVLETVAVAVRHPNVYVDISALPAAEERAVLPILALCIKKGLGDRLLFGSDFPLVDPARYVLRLKRAGPGPLLRRILGLPALTPDLRARLLGLNAAKLLRLP